MFHTKRIPSNLVVIALLTAFTFVLLPGPSVSAADADVWRQSASGGFDRGDANLLAGPIVEHDGSVFSATAGEDGLMVYEKTGPGWTSISGAGFGDTGNMAALGLQSYGGDLYAGTANIDGCQIWRYDGGTAWTQIIGQDAEGTAVTGPGFGDKYNIAVGSMEVFDGKLFVGLVNYSVDIDAFVFGSAGSEIWSFDGTVWQKETTSDGGFDDPNNIGVTGLIDYGGELYATTLHLTFSYNIFTSTIGVHGHGWELWKKSVGSWTKVAEETADHNTTKNIGIMAMETFGDELYMGTMNLEADVVVDLSTFDISSMTFHSDGSEVLKYNSTTDVLEPVMQGGFNDTSKAILSMCTTKTAGSETLLVASGNVAGAGLSDLSATGVIKSFDGNSWSEVSTEGFGNPYNMLIFSLFNDSGNNTYAGTVNTNAGCEVWWWPNPSLSSITPNEGTSGKTLSGAVVYGDNLDQAAEVYLAKDLHTVDGVISPPTLDDKIAADFDLSEAPAGLYDLVVIDHLSKYSTLDDAFTVNVPAPVITSISPTPGRGSRVFTIKGANFGSSRGSSYVTFWSTKCADSDYISWSNTQIVAKVPVIPAPTIVTITVTTEGGTSNSMDFEVEGRIIVPVPTSLWYLAEGTTDWGFDCYISIANPNDTQILADVTYMTKDGAVDGGSVTLPAESQTTIDPRQIIGNTDFSTEIFCRGTNQIAVDRTMSWTGDGAASPDGHCSVGVTEPDNTWYLAEGSSAWGFETWLLMQNPNGEEATCTVTYMIEGGSPVIVEKKIPANSRRSYNMEDDIGKKDASIKVESDIPVIPERAMYRNNKREGHDSIGTTVPANDYYLAEGATGYGPNFVTWVLVQNPNDEPANVAITYLTSSGEVTGPTMNMPANSRWTVKVNDYLPDGSDVSTHVHGDKPIIAERAMYWDSGLGEACHDSIGMDQPHDTFYLPDGETSKGHETWTLVQNPNNSDVEVRVTYLTPDGTGNRTFTDTVPAKSRKTYNMADEIINGRAAILIESITADSKIMVERAMYWNNRGAGTATIGACDD